VNRWALLVVAIITEVAGTLALRGAVDRPWLYTVTAVGYVVSFLALVRLLQDGAALGVVYGIWSALGVAATAGLSTVLFDEAFTGVMVAGLVLIVGGVVLVEAGSHPAGEDGP
jgi:small multidrug resistance pump